MSMARIAKFKVPDVITVDFETKGIQRRPEYPPKPVGVSIIMPGERKSTYYAWGHPTKNNCTEKQGHAKVKEAWELARTKKIGLLFQNGKFDVDVAEVHCGVKRLDWSLYHDTMFLIFLSDPHAETYSLKPAAERILGMPPEEQDAVKEWVLAHKREISQKYGLAKDFTPSEWGAYICEAPGDLVGKYADGDTIRTLKLFKHLYPDVWARGMAESYDRERKLMPILMDNERAGMRIDVPGLERDIEQYRSARTTADNWLRKTLKAPDLNIDSDKDMAAALKRAGVVTDFVKTPTGQDSVSKKNLTADLFNDKRVFATFGYRNRLTTCLTMFMERWHSIGHRTGYINTTWNQVRQSRSSGNNGTRTGRPSTSDPNFLNLSKSWYDKNDGYVHPKHLKSLPELPLVRKYILPDPGGVFLHRDYNQQELRLLAHFENDKLMDAYNANPRMDVHQFVVDAVYEILGLKLERRAAKVVNFGLLYGMGLGKLSEDMDTDVETAKRIKKAQLSALPGLKALQDDINALAKGGQPIHTFGGREYYPEPSKIINGRLVDFIYKLLNYLIQGSAADFTKEAIIRYHDVRKDSRFLVTVYDEINISAPKGSVKREMKALREAMEGIPNVDVPMLTDGKSGLTWGDLAKYED
jgi:DNA polymerase-1